MVRWFSNTLFKVWGSKTWSLGLSFKVDRFGVLGFLERCTEHDTVQGSRFRGGIRVSVPLNPHVFCALTVTLQSLQDFPCPVLLSRPFEPKPDVTSYFVGPMYTQHAPRTTLKDVTARERGRERA